MASRREGLRRLLPKPPKPPSKSNAECCRDYMERVKEDPHKLAEFKLTKEVAHARWFANRTDEQKERDRENSRKCMAKKRARDKSCCTSGANRKPTSTATSKSSKTRSETKNEEQKRLAAAERKRRSRAKGGAAKRDQEREYQRERYLDKKTKAANQPKNKSGRTSDHEKEKKVHNISLGRVMKTARESLKMKRDKTSLCKLHFLNGLLLGNINPSSKSLYKRRPRDTIVEQFYEEAATDLPSKRSISTISMKAKKVLTKTVKCLFLEFKQKHPHYKVSLTSFARRRPEHVLLSSSSSFRQCLCMNCENPKLKVRKINAFLPQSMKLKHEDDLVAHTLCKEDPLRRECVEGKCSKCGVPSFLKTLEEYLPKVQEPATWLRWEKTASSPMDKVEKEGTWKELMGEFEEELKTLAMHLTTARWQRQQYHDLLETLSTDSAVITIDFAENYLCRFQDEIQSAHWSYKQVTLCPTVLQYHCSSPCNERVTEYITAISDDKHHDAAFGKKVLNDQLDHLENKGIKHIHIWSDGCACQFKSKLPFLYITELQEEHPNLIIERHFFGAGHGKSLCDGSGGTTKGCATRAVASGQYIIQNASQLFQFCSDKLVLSEAQEDHDKSKPHLRRSFKVYTSEQISRLKQADSYKTLKGSRSIHHLKPKATIGEIAFRRLSCFCKECKEGNDCKNENLVGKWTDGVITPTEGKRNPSKRGIKKSLPSRSRSASKATKDDVTTRALPSTSHAPSKETNSKRGIKDTLPVPSMSRTASKAAKSDLTTETRTASPAASEAQTTQDTIELKESDTDQHLPPTLDMPPTPLTPLSSNEADRRDDFFNLSQKLQNATSFDEFQDVATENQSILTKHSLSVKTGMTIGQFQKDKTATLLFPSDGPKNVTPIKVTGDGNCLAYCASILAFGHENNGVEMRVRMAMEMALHKDLYLSENVSQIVPGLPRKAAMYSDEYVTQVLTPHVLEQWYELEVRKTVNNYRYLGILQLYAVATMLQCKIESIYPEGVGYNVRKDLHHCVHPVRGTAGDMEYGVMWSHCRGWHGPKSHWSPNHFVVCLPPCFQTKVAASEFVLVRLPHATNVKETKKPDLFVAELTTGEMEVLGQRGAWGVFFVRCNNGMSWKKPQEDRGSFFLPLSDITMILEDYALKQDGRSIVFSFEHA